MTAEVETMGGIGGRANVEQSGELTFAIDGGRLVNRYLGTEFSRNRRAEPNTRPGARQLSKAALSRL
jgi:hypothetical protein